VKAEVTAADKGGAPGQCPARNAQLAVQEYKRRSGGYVGSKAAADNHLVRWQREEWDTKSGHASGEIGERHLPKRKREALTPAEY
jgi:hypothetical protein